MRPDAVARNYAATLYELARREDAIESFGALIEQLARFYGEERAFRSFLDTPRVPLPAKKEALRASLGAGAPELFLRFLFVVLEKRRQRVIPGIATAYGDLVDRQAGRVHASITLPIEADEDLRREILEGLERILGLAVVPHFHRSPELLGGIVVRVGDRLMDGSIRRRLEDLRGYLLGGAEAIQH
ncbi:MAG: ATP synthase F1 subunit delta [Gemmatimonadota bacterium]